MKDKDTVYNDMVELKGVSEIQMGNKASLFKVEPGQNSQTKPK